MQESNWEGHSDTPCRSQHGRGALQTLTPQPLSSTQCAFLPSLTQPRAWGRRASTLLCILFSSDTGQRGRPSHGRSQLSPSWSSQTQQHPNLLSELLWSSVVVAVKASAFTVSSSWDPV